MTFGLDHCTSNQASLAIAPKAIHDAIQRDMSASAAAADPTTTGPEDAGAEYAHDLLLGGEKKLKIVSSLFFPSFPMGLVGEWYCLGRRDGAALKEHDVVAFSLVPKCRSAALTCDWE